MIDFYTKAVLTVIAMALVAIVGQNLTRQAVAFNGSCGEYAPCEVRVVNEVEIFTPTPIPVTVYR